MGEDQCQRKNTSKIAAFEGGGGGEVHGGRSVGVGGQGMALHERGQRRMGENQNRVVKKEKPKKRQKID